MAHLYDREDREIDEEAIDRSRFVPNLYSPDPPALSPTLLHDPKATRLMEERLQQGWENVLRHLAPGSTHDFTVYTGKKKRRALGTVCRVPSCFFSYPPFMSAYFFFIGCMLYTQVWVALPM